MTGNTATRDTPAGADGHAAAASRGAALIAVHGVDFSYNGPPVLQQVNLEVRAGDFACLIGPNGGGKSTLLRIMLGLLRPQRGHVHLLGRDPMQTRQRVGYMPQTSSFDADFPIGVLEVVLMGRLGRGWRIGPWGKADRDAARSALCEVGLDGLGPRPFASLSGGQRQRVLIARALAAEPEILMLDEPTSNVDITAEEQIYALLEHLNQRLTIVMVSHDVGYVSRAVRTAVCVNRTVHTHPPRELDGEAIRRLYGREVRTLHAGAAAPTFSPHVPAAAATAPAPDASHCECGHDHPPGTRHGPPPPPGTPA